MPKHSFKTLFDGDRAALLQAGFLGKAETLLASIAPPNAQRKVTGCIVNSGYTCLTTDVDTVKISVETLWLGRQMLACARAQHGAPPARGCRRPSYTTFGEAARE